MTLGSDLNTAIDSQDYTSAIQLVAENVRRDRRTLSEPTVKRWLGLSFRSLFISATAADAAAGYILTSNSVNVPSLVSDMLCRTQLV